MKQQMIIWDWNGTLLNDLEISMESLNHILKQENLPLVKDKQTYQKYFRFPVIEYYQDIGFDFKKRSFESLAQEYMHYYQPRSLQCSLHEEAEEVLQYFLQKGYRQVLLSASKLDFLHQQIRQYPIVHYFSDVLGLDNIHAHSKAQLAKNFVQQHKDTYDVVFIGDSVHDYEVSQVAHASCILSSKGHEASYRLRQTGCHIVDDLKQLKTML